MALPPGTRFGPYKILAPLGAGGMGEVYRAKDTRLDRTVAIKVLPAHLSTNADAKQRFEREARAVSSLNHPHICTLHDIGHQDGIDFIVMEYLEGETLAQRISKGPLPLDQVLRYSVEIADALDKAHRQGVIHRDSKPGNIMLTKSGSKLLDFGLAKLGASASTAAGISALATGTEPLTGAGSILGTFQYMAPEQLEGKEADARTDIFTFGATVYEMATGRKAFEGKSQASLITAIMSSEPPPISTLQPMTPPALDHVVRRCLAKEPDDRFQTARDVMLELKWITEGGSQVGAPTAVVASPKRRERLLWITVTALLLLATLVVSTVAIKHFREAPEEMRAVRFFILPTEKSSFNFVGNNAGPVTVSPDGRRLAFVATTAEGKNLLWVRSLDALSAQALTGTEGASFPFWSPDSRFLGFFADGRLKRIEAAGGPDLTLREAPAGRGGTWNRNGVIVFAPNTRGALYRVSASGGTASAVTNLDEARGEAQQRWPYFLPDGQHFLYLGRGLHSGPSEKDAIYIASLESKERKLLLRASLNVVYARGYLLFLREGTLMAQPFDAKRLETTGDGFPIAEQIQYEPFTARGVFSVSEDAVLAYQTGSGASGSQLAWFDRGGKPLGVLGDPASYAGPQLSSDGKRAAVIIANQNGTQNIWLYEVVRGLRTRFTFDPAVERSEMWSPDGSRIVFTSNSKGHFDLYQKASSWAGSEELLLESNLDKYPTSWSRDGRFLLYYTRPGDPKTKSDLWVLSLSGDQKPFPFLQTESNETEGRFSPDGRWIAYTSDESRRSEIYVAPFPVPGGKRQISTSGGQQPKWRGDGKEIFYLAPDNKLMAAEVNGQGATLEVGAVRPLFEARPTGPGYVYDVTADGQRFLINSSVEQRVSSPITLVLNWSEEVKARAGSR